MTDILHRISKAANDLATAQRDLEKSIAAQQRAEAEIKYLSEEVLPALLEEGDQGNTASTSGGHVVKVKSEIVASISNQEEAFAWLESIGEGGVIKRDVTVAFNKDQELDAKDLKAQLLQEGYPAAKIKGTVHWATLRKIARTRLEAGEDIPPCIFVETKDVAELK